MGRVGLTGGSDPIHLNYLPNCANRSGMSLTSSFFAFSGFSGVLNFLFGMIVSPVRYLGLIKIAKVKFQEVRGSCKMWSL